MATKFFLCTTCGNVVVKVVDSGVVPVCCGDEMQELVPASTDGALERHVPVVECRDDCTIVVKVGSLPHPMAEEHHIAFIFVETANGGQIQYLKPMETPQALISFQVSQAMTAGESPRPSSLIRRALAR